MIKVLENIAIEVVQVTYGKADDELIEQRMRICKLCKEFNPMNNGMNVCGKLLNPVEGQSCGCDLNIKWNGLRLSCPQKRW